MAYPDFEVWTQFPLGQDRWMQFTLTDRAGIRPEDFDYIIGYLKLMKKHAGPSIAERAAGEDLARLDKRAGKLFSFENVKLAPMVKREAPKRAAQKVAA